MQINGYGKVQQNRYRKLKRRLTGLIIILIVAIITVALVGIFASDSKIYQDRITILEENHALKEQAESLQAQVDELEKKVSELEGTVAERDEYISSIPTTAPTAPAEDEPTASPEATQHADSLSPRE